LINKISVYLCITPSQGLLYTSSHFSQQSKIIFAVLELHSLNLQLQNLKVLLEDAVKNDKPFFEQIKISKQIFEVEKKIEERKEITNKQESPD